MIDYDSLDAKYEAKPSKVKMEKSMKPVGSLTDNARKIKPNRDGSHKRLAIFSKRGY